MWKQYQLDSTSFYMVWTKLGTVWGQFFDFFSLDNHWFWAIFLKNQKEIFSQKDNEKKWLLLIGPCKV